jgi:hypothetical protein
MRQFDTGPTMTRVISRPRSGRYRKMPALSGGGLGSCMRKDDYPAGREGRCARRTGHTLVVEDGRILCNDCGAEWQDFGY